MSGPAKTGRRSILALPLLLAACASAEPAYYTLAAQPGVAQAGGAQAGGAQPGGVRLVELRRIGLAGYLDRPEIVRTSADYRLHLESGERWGEPLGALIARVLAEDLNTRLPGSAVFTSAGSISAEPDATVEIDLQRFDADATGMVVVLAQVAVTRGRQHPAARTVRLTVTPRGPSTTELVAALSTALAQLADQIAALLRA